jgi:hypothetical protein
MPPCTLTRLLACGASLLLAATPALAGGGRGSSYCSNATGPGQGSAFSAGQYGSSYANPGEIVSSLIGILWGQGVGAPTREPGLFTRTVCDPAKGR